MAINTNTGGILAVGAEAKKMIGRTPGNIVAVRPLKDGVIADFEITERMLRYFFLKIHKRRYLARPPVVVCVPSGITGVERRAVIEASSQAGARQVHVIPEPWPPPPASGLPTSTHGHVGNTVVDVSVPVSSPARARTSPAAGRHAAGRYALVLCASSATWPGSSSRRTAG
ncbi:Cell shape-determining protein MreB [Streptomyces canarius]